MYELVCRVFGDDAAVETAAVGLRRPAMVNSGLFMRPNAKLQLRNPQGSVSKQSVISPLRAYISSSFVRQTLSCPDYFTRRLVRGAMRLSLIPSADRERQPSASPQRASCAPR